MPLRVLPRNVCGLSLVNRGAVLCGTNLRGPRYGTRMYPLPAYGPRLRHRRPRVGFGRARRSRADRSSGRPRCGTAVRGLAAYRPLRSKRRRPRLGHGRTAASVRGALRSLADRSLRGGGTGRMWNPLGLLRQGRPLGAQQQAQRDQNKGRGQHPSVLRGNALRATSTVSGTKKPVVIFHNPQRRHTLQRPADHPARSW